MSETRPASGAIATTNDVLDGTIVSATSEASLYPKSNLLSAHRSKRWRSTSNALQQIVGQFKDTASPNMLALIDSNIDTPASDLAAALAKARLWFKADRETAYSDGGQVHKITDYSGNGNDFAIGTTFLATSRVATFTQWHKADAITPQADNTALASWLDSGVGGTPAAGQSTGSKQPAYRTGDGAGGLNGKPTLRFDGGDVLAYASAIDFGTAHTIVIVFRTSGTADDTVLFGDDVSTCYVRFLQASSTLRYRTFTDVVGVTWLPAQNQWYTLVIQRSGANVKFIVDGLQIGSTQVLGTSSTVFQGRYIGADDAAATLPLTGNIAELLVSTSVSDETAVEATEWMARKYALTCAPAVTYETAEKDAKAVLRYDGTMGFAGYGDQLSYNSGVNAGLLLGTAQTIVMAFKLSTINATNTLLGDTAAGGTGSFVRYISAGTLLRFQAGSGGYVEVTQSLTATQWYVLAIVRSGASVSFYLDGVQVGTTQTLGSPYDVAEFGLKSIGADNFTGGNRIVGDIAEVFVATSAFTAGERKAIEDYLAAKWALTMTYGSVILELANDLAFTSSVQRWALQSYAQSKRRTLRWYLWVPDNSYVTDAAWQALIDAGFGARSFWRLTLPAGAVLDSDGDGDVDTYHELGVALLGEYTDVEIQSGVKVGFNDPSERSEAYGGALYVDTLRPFLDVDLEIIPTAFATVYALRELLETLGSAYALLDLHGNTTDVAIKAHSSYYGVLSGRRGFSLAIVSPTENSLAISFEEARG